MIGVAIVNNELIKQSTEIIQFSNKEVTQNFLAKLCDGVKGIILYKLIEDFVHFDDDLDINSLCNDDNINFEGFKVMSRIFNERSTLT